MKAATPVIVAASIRAARLAIVFGDRVLIGSSNTSSSIRLWTWIAKSMPRPIRIGQTGDRDE
jgi:hypothetical protein